jgi:hypothetical protein
MSDDQLSAALEHPKTWRRALRLVDALAASADERTTFKDRRALWKTAWSDDATALTVAMAGAFRNEKTARRVREALLVRSGELKPPRDSALVLRQAVLSEVLRLIDSTGPRVQNSPAWRAVITAVVDPDFVPVLKRYLTSNPESIEIALDVRSRALEIDAYALLVGLCKNSPASAAELWELTVSLNAAA